MSAVAILELRGEHCSDPLCRQFDTLPFKCQECRQPLCLEHFKDHPCKTPSLQIPKCSQCGWSLSEDTLQHSVYREDEQLRVLLSSISTIRKELQSKVHIESESASKERDRDVLSAAFLLNVSEDFFWNQQRGLSKQLLLLRQQVFDRASELHRRSGCFEKNPRIKSSCHLGKCRGEGMKVTCKSCKNQFCLKHRLPEVHQCCASR
jgi:predicted nucleic acid binding AN1-type Zn finger protein